MRPKQTTISLNPNSYYHSMLINRYGQQGALEQLRRSSLGYALTMVDYNKVKAYGKKHGKKPRLNLPK